MPTAKPDQDWSLVYYVLPSGRKPVDEFLEDLELNDPRAAAAFFGITLPALRKHGPGVGAPTFEHIRAKGFAKNVTGFGEIRWRASDRGHCRIYCSIELGRKLVLYHGVVKRWRKFDDQETAKKRYDDYHSDGYSGAGRERLRRT